jgi:hypothetical protein
MYELRRNQITLWTWNVRVSLIAKITHALTLEIAMPNKNIKETK